MSEHESTPTGENAARIQRVETTRPYRDSLEFRFFAELHPCPFCGNRDVDNLAYKPWTNIDGIDRYRLVGPCSQCGAQRVFQAVEGGQESSKGIAENRGLVQNPAPSTIIGPHEFLAEYVRVDPMYPREPEVLTPQQWRESQGLGHVMRAQECVVELGKFLRPGEDVIADDAYVGDGWPAAKHADPERYTRAWIEAALAPLAAMEARYRAQFPRLEADPGPARPIELPGGPLGTAAIAAHDTWTKRGGRGEGTRIEIRDRTFRRVELSAKDLRGTILERVVLDGANLTFAKLQAATWTNVTLVRAALGSASLAGSTLTDCDFTKDDLGLTKLGDATITGCRFDDANVDRSTWYRSKVTRCSFRNAILGHAAFDHAVFTDCDFRNADLSLREPYLKLLGTAFDTVFERCDFRDTRWDHRVLYRTRFVDCRFGGVSGAPRSVVGMVCERPDLSDDGTGSPQADRLTLCAIWGMDLDAVRGEDAEYLSATTPKPKPKPEWPEPW